jgi:hypothetical protein
MPEPVLVSIAAAIAAKSATSLYDLVKRKFAGRDDAAETLLALEGAAPDSPEISAFATRLAAAEAEDPAFSAELRHTWQEVNATRGGVVNQILGNVSGKVVQARDIQGGISL